MGRDGISIPVSVVGAKQAQQEVRAVAESVKELKQASAGGSGADLLRETQGEQATAGQTGADALMLAQQASVAQAMQATGRAARGAAEGVGELGAQQMGLTHGSSVALYAILMHLSPELAGLTHLVLSLSRALAGASAFMLGLFGATAAIGGIVALFNEWAEAAKRAEEATKRADEARRAAMTEGATTRTAYERRATALGMYGAGTRIQGEARQLQDKLGLPEDLAASVAIAEQYAQQNKMAFDRKQMMQGLLVRGGKPISEERDKYPAELAATLTAGKLPAGEEALTKFLSQVGPEVRTGAPTASEMFRDQIALSAKRLGRQRPQFTSEEVAAAERIAKLGLPELYDPAKEREVIGAAVRKGAIEDVPWTMGRIPEPHAGAHLGGGATVDDLVKLAREIGRDAEFQGNIQGKRPDVPSVPSTQPVTITQIFNTTHNNVDTAYTLGQRGGRSSASGALELDLPGESLAN